MYSLFILPCLLSAVLGQDIPQEPQGYLIPSVNFIGFCMGKEKAELIFNAEAECQATIDESLSSTPGMDQQGLFVRFMGKHFGLTMCVLNKIGMVKSDGQMDQKKIVEFFTCEHTQSVLATFEDRCLAEAEAEDVNHFFESWEDMYNEVKHQLQGNMGEEQEEIVQAGDRRLRIGEKLREKAKAAREKRRKNKQKQDEEQIEVEESQEQPSVDPDTICQVKDMVKHSKVNENGEELDVVEEYCKLPVAVRKSVRDAMKPMAFWRCIKETRYFVCASKLQSLMEENAGLVKL